MECKRCPFGSKCIIQVSKSCVVLAMVDNYRKNNKRQGGLFVEEIDNSYRDIKDRHREELIRYVEKKVVEHGSVYAAAKAEDKNSSTFQAILRNG